MSDYRLNDPSKGIIGPVRLNTVRDLIEAGVIGADVVVSKDNGPFMPLSHYKEIPALKEAPNQAPRPTYAGDIGKITFFKVFYRLHLSRANGLLVLEDGPWRKDIYLVDGAPSLVFSNGAYERLGEFLALNGTLKRTQLDGALASVARDDMRLGEVLLKNDVLKGSQLASALRDQAIFRLVDLCLWETGRYVFFEGQRPGGGRTDLQLSVPDLIVEAARQMPERGLMRRLAPHYYKPVVPTSRFATQLKQMHFSDAEKAIIKSFDGRRTVADIACHYGDDANLRRGALMTMYLLWEVDAVSYDAQGASSSPSSTPSL